MKTMIGVLGEETQKKVPLNVLTKSSGWVYLLEKRRKRAIIA